MTEQLDGAASPENHLALVSPPSVGLSAGLAQECPPIAAVTGRPPTPYVAFDRRELMDILKVYGRMVAAGEWRDYALDTLADRAVFSIFRRTSEMPLYRIEKNPKLARRQGAYAVIAQSGLILKRGSELPQVLRVFDKALLKLAE